MLAFKNGRESVRFLAERFGESYMQISPNYWAWIPPTEIELKLVSVEAGPTIIERWTINGEQFVIERYDTHDEIYQEVDW